MSKDFDLATALEGLTAEEALEFVTTQLSPRAKEQFLAGKKDESLRAKYEEEVRAIKGVNSFTNAKRLNDIKAKYRGQGLEVW